MDYLNAFLCGGILCAIGQILIDKTPLTPARILTGYVVCGVLLTAIGVYEPIVKWGGAGATVPLTGFGYNLARGVKQAVQEDGWLGVLTGGAALSTLFSVRSAAAFLVFTLLYTPCVAAVAAIRRELDSVWKTFGVVVFQCLLAWGLGAAVYQIALLI
mgnify:CR=1 FL=1